MNATLTIRPAVLSDVPLILTLIKELAEYEKLLHEVTATEANLESTLFGDKPVAEVLVAFEDIEPVGFALFFHNYSTFLGKPGIYLEDLYIRPAFRGKGHGKQILQYVATLAVERNCGRFEWSVLDWNQLAIDFYHAMGAEAMSDWTVQRVSGDALKELASACESCKV